MAEHEKQKKEIAELLEKISKYDSSKNKSGYYRDKEAIEKLFESTRENLDESKIRIRLTVLDSMYSTQMKMHPFGVEDLANALWKCYLKNGSAVLKDKLSQITQNPDKMDTEIQQLFSDTYGAKPNNATAVSLISKYFYFETGFKFPIYDSIVREYLPRLYEYCGEPPKGIHANDIIGYIKTINYFFTDVIKYTADESRYDTLDHLLWVAGKIISGNLSLLLNKEQYEKITRMIEYINFIDKKQKNNIDDSDRHGYITAFQEVVKNDLPLSEIADVAFKLPRNKRSKKKEANGD